MEESDLINLKKEVKVSRIINIASLVINALLICLLVYVFTQAKGIANEAMKKVDEVKPALEKVSTIDIANINEAVIKLKKTIDEIEWEMVSKKLSQLDVNTINKKINDLDVDMLQAKIRNLDIQTLNKKLNEIDAKEFSKAAENLNKIVEKLKNLPIIGKK